MAFLCGCISKAGKEKLWAMIVGAIVGAVSYVCLYLGKSFIEDFFVLGLPLEGVMLSIGTKAITSTVNGIIAAAVSVPLCLSLKPMLRKANLL